MIKDEFPHWVIFGVEQTKSLKSRRFFWILTGEMQRSPTRRFTRTSTYSSSTRLLSINHWIHLDFSKLYIQSNSQKGDVSGVTTWSHRWRPIASAVSPIFTTYARHRFTWLRKRRRGSLTTAFIRRECSWWLMEGRWCLARWLGGDKECGKQTPYLDKGGLMKTFLVEFRACINFHILWVYNPMHLQKIYKAVQTGPRIKDMIWYV